MKAKHAVMTGVLLKERVLRILAEFKLVDFSASEGWIRNFKKQHAIRRAEAGATCLHESRPILSASLPSRPFGTIR
jgi:hypothetical protein